MNRAALLALMWGTVSAAVLSALLLAVVGGDAPPWRRNGAPAPEAVTPLEAARSPVLEEPRQGASAAGGAAADGVPSPY